MADRSRSDRQRFGKPGAQDQLPSGRRAHRFPEPLRLEAPLEATIGALWVPRQPTGPFSAVLEVHLQPDARSARRLRRARAPVGQRLLPVEPSEIGVVGDPRARARAGSATATSRAAR